MTTARWVRDVLQDQWGSGDNSPPSQPNITVEGDEGKRSVHHLDNDVIFTQDGGLPTVRPQSIGFREEYVEASIDVEIVTSQGRERLLGLISESYGGLSGEVKRIVDKYRIGYPSDGNQADPGYDIARIDTFDDQIGARGADMWAGTWTITFITYANQIGQDAANRA